MMSTKRVCAAFVFTGLVCLGVGYGLQNRAWPPPVQKVTEDSPPLSPADAMKTFFLAPGYRIELVASEPMVSDPVAIDFGPDGRMYVVEMPGFAPDESGVDSRDPTGRVVVLQDTDDDGKMDKRIVFLDTLILPRTVKVLEHGVLVAEPPNLILARDTNGDGKADTREIVQTNYGRLEGNPEHNANSLMWGMDNWLHTSEHNWYYRWKNGKIEAAPTLNRGQWGISQDDAGRIYRNWNEQPLFVDFVSAAHYLRNPNLVRTRGLYEELIARHETFTWPVRPTRGVNRGYREGALRPDGSMVTYLSSATPVIYRGDRLPKEIYGDAFITDCSGQFVHRLVFVDDGAGRIRARDAYPKGEFLASTDERFRPVNAMSAPDGTLYVVDMYRGVIQDQQYWSEYLRDYIKTHKLALPIGLGRIYRVVHETTKRDRKPSLDNESPAQLVERLAHPNGWWRDMAQQLLVERGDRSVVAALKDRAAKAADWRTRLHALWTLDGLESLDAPTVKPALADKSPFVRAAAIRLSERWLSESSHPLRSEVLKLINDRHWQVRRQLAASLGALPADARVDPVAQVLEKYGSDEVTVDAALSGLAGQESEMLSTLLARKLTAQQGADSIAMLAGAIARSRDLAATGRLFDVAADTSRAPWQRIAVLNGVDLGLPGGAGGPRGGGGRGGFGRGGPVGGLSFSSEPVKLTSLAASGTGELGDLAKRISARVTWPGKPTPRTEITPLTAEEQTRADAGRQVYANVCAGCHQEDGQGKEKMGPPLAGSRWVTGNPGVVIRVLVSGKEGTSGLMPPFASSLNDEQLAAVITYIRRAWGHNASPVARAEVREIRGLTASRKAPYTEQELTRLGGGFRGARGGQ